VKKSREELRAKLLAQAEEAIDELLEWEEQAGKLSMTQIEDKLLKVRQWLGEQMATLLVSQQEAKRDVQLPR
jgi:hypothetical protein